MGKRALPDNVLLWLSLPLLPALIGAWIGILVRVFVGVGARCRVEAVAHALAVCAPTDPVVGGNGPLQPFGKVVGAPVPAEDPGEETFLEHQSEQFRLGEGEAA